MADAVKATPHNSRHRFHEHIVPASSSNCQNAAIQSFDVHEGLMKGAESPLHVIIRAKSEFLF